MAGMAGMMVAIRRESYLNQLVQCLLGGLPSGKRLHNYGKSQFLMEKSTIKSNIMGYQNIMAY
jgi:hypothetical protein